MPEMELLEKIRRYALWTTLIAAGLVMVLTILWVWEAITLIDTSPDIESGDSLKLMSIFTDAGKLMITASTAMSIGLTILLAQLVASWIKKDDK